MRNIFIERRAQMTVSSSEQIRGHENTTAFFHGDKSPGYKTFDAH